MGTYQHDSDEKLLEALRNSDEKAFSELFRRYWRTVHRMAYEKVRSKEITQEIVQEFFMTLWDKRATQNIPNIPAFIYVCVKNKAINYIASRIVKEKYWSYYRSFVPQTEHSTEKAVEYNDLMEAMEEGVDSLPSKSKMVFQLNRVQGHSIPEIASILNLSEKAIEYHLTRSLKQLRIHLKDFFIFLFLVSFF